MHTKVARLQYLVTTRTSPNLLGKVSQNGPLEDGYSKT